MAAFFKRINRGLVLGGIVLVGFIIFVIADTAAFKKDKPEIKNAVTEYVDSLSELAVTPQELQSIDITKLTNAQTSEIDKKIEKNVNQYWTYEGDDNGNYYGFNKSEYRSSLDLLKEKDTDSETKDGVGYVTKWTPEINWSQSSISKNGPDGVKITLECQIVADYVGNPYILSPALPSTPNDMDYSGEALSLNNAKKQIEINGTYTIYMKKESGTWKITFTDSWGRNTQVHTIEDGGDEA